MTNNNINTLFKKNIKTLIEKRAITKETIWKIAVQYDNYLKNKLEKFAQEPGKPEATGPIPNVAVNQNTTAEQVEKDKEGFLSTYLNFDNIVEKIKSYISNPYARSALIGALLSLGPALLTVDSDNSIWRTLSKLLIFSAIGAAFGIGFNALYDLIVNPQSIITSLANRLGIDGSIVSRFLSSGPSDTVTTIEEFKNRVTDDPTFLTPIVEPKTGKLLTTLSGRDLIEHFTNDNFLKNILELGKNRYSGAKNILWKYIQNVLNNPNTLEHIVSTKIPDAAGKEVRVASFAAEPKGLTIPPNIPEYIRKKLIREYLTSGASPEVMAILKLLANYALFRPFKEHPYFNKIIGPELDAASYLFNLIPGNDVDLRKSVGDFFSNNQETPNFNLPPAIYVPLLLNPALVANAKLLRQALIHSPDLAKFILNATRTIPVGLSYSANNLNNLMKILATPYGRNYYLHRLNILNPILSKLNELGNRATTRISDFWHRDIFNLDKKFNTGTNGPNLTLKDILPESLITELKNANIKTISVEALNNPKTPLHKYVKNLVHIFNNSSDPTIKDNTRQALENLTGINYSSSNQLNLNDVISAIQTRIVGYDENILKALTHDLNKGRLLFQIIRDPNSSFNQQVRKLYDEFNSNTTSPQRKNEIIEIFNRLTNKVYGVPLPNYNAITTDLISSLHDDKNLLNRVARIWHKSIFGENPKSIEAVDIFNTLSAALRQPGATIRTFSDPGSEVHKFIKQQFEILSNPISSATEKAYAERIIKTILGGNALSARPLVKKLIDKYLFNEFISNQDINNSRLAQLLLPLGINPNKILTQTSKKVHLMAKKMLEELGKELNRDLAEPSSYSSSLEAVLKSKKSNFYKYMENLLKKFGKGNTLFDMAVAAFFSRLGVDVNDIQNKIKSNNPDLIKNLPDELIDSVVRSLSDLTNPLRPIYLDRARKPGLTTRLIDFFKPRRESITIDNNLLQKDVESIVKKEFPEYLLETPIRQNLPKLITENLRAGHDNMLQELAKSAPRRGSGSGLPKKILIATSNLLDRAKPKIKNITSLDEIWNTGKRLFLPFKNSRLANATFVAGIPLLTEIFSNYLESQTPIDIYSKQYLEDLKKTNTIENAQLGGVINNK
ncbi:MAG: hypothetical protein KatS3mg035_1796 [Bacteroidia bacterium]|nr:MAG: hypothetical protein KatS3mg035_1796 [Bacteroidia bacterium]